MVWRPIREAHAIERVRLIVEFSSPLTTKLLTRCAQAVYEKSESFDFDAKERVPSNTMPGFSISINGLSPGQPEANGYVLRRHNSGNLIEEVGFRDSVFGYVTTEYARWQNFNSRLEDVFYPSLKQAFEYTDFATLRLEYWDRFNFDGEPAQADASMLLHQVDAVIPPTSIQGKTLWHSHVGWFEEFEGTPYLVNRNLDANDFTDGDGVSKRGVAVYTLMEARMNGKDVGVDDIHRHFNEMHRRSVLLLGSSIKEEIRAQIGLKLEAYQK